MLLFLFRCFRHIWPPNALWTARARHCWAGLPESCFQHVQTIEGASIFMQKTKQNKIISSCRAAGLISASQRGIRLLLSPATTKTHCTHIRIHTVTVDFSLLLPILSAFMYGHLQIYTFHVSFCALCVWARVLQFFPPFARQTECVYMIASKHTHANLLFYVWMAFVLMFFIFLNFMTVNRFANGWPRSVFILMLNNNKKSTEQSKWKYRWNEME